MTDVLLEALQEAGIPAPPSDVVLGKYTRWGAKKEYYAIQLHDGSGYCFGNFKEEGSQRAVFFDKSGQRKKKLTEADKKAIAEARAFIAKESEASHEATAAACNKYWASMIFVNSHPYLAKKKVSAHGVKGYKDKIVIPLYDTNGKLWSFQYIGPDGTKSFKSGGRKKSLFFPIGFGINATPVPARIQICEGFATGATIFECSRTPVAVAFDAGNLYSVVEALKQKYPDADLKICADNDTYGDVNSGVSYALRASEKFHTKITFPIFGSGKFEIENPTDYNDLYILKGADEVNKQLKPRNITEVTSNSNPNAPSRAGAPEASQESENSQKESGGAAQESLEESSTPVQTSTLFQLSDDCLAFFDKSKKEFVRISDPVKVVALTLEIEEENAGRILQYRDRTGKIKETKIFDSWLTKDGAKMHDDLYRNGFNLDTSSVAKRMLNEYINSSCPRTLIKYTIKSGWRGKCFLTADEVFGESQENIVHKPSVEPAHFEISGTLEEWQQNIARLCVGNSRLIFALSAAFASMLLTPCGADNFFLHFYGRSSRGKTTMLDTAASIFGSHAFTRTWRVTDNGLEGTAMAHNDLCLFLDEIGECDAYKVGAIAYMLVNGVGKTRANSSGCSRRVARWKIGGISTGEEHIADVIKSTGRNPKAGQLLRILSIPAVPEGSEYGLFEDIHEFNNSAKFANHLQRAAQKYHGTAFRAFIQAAADNYDDLVTLYDDTMNQAIEEYLPKDASGQDTRAFRSFITCAVGGIFASQMDVTGWPKEIILPAVSKCFYEWLDAKGGVGSQEDKQALDQIRLFFEKYGSARFQFIDGSGVPDDMRQPHERAGYRRVDRYSGETTYLVYPRYFDEVIARGIDAKHVKKLLKDKGILETDGDHARYQKNVRIREHTYRMIVLNDKILNEDEKNDWNL